MSQTAQLSRPSPVSLQSSLYRSLADRLQPTGLVAVADPLRFCRELLGHDLWPVQERIAQSVERNRRTAVKSCHASGKSFLAADLTLWWLKAFDDGIVITTGPSWATIQITLWPMIHLALADATRIGIVAFPEPLQTALHLGPNHYALGRSTNRGVRFQGLHGHILIIVDEAPGLLPEIWEAIRGIAAAGEVHVLALGNPTIASGQFHEAFTSQRASWETITISAFDTPNLAGCTLADLAARDREDPWLDEAQRPYLTSRRFVWEAYHDLGPTNPVFQARVLGEFPTQSENSLLSLAWLEAAKYREATDESSRIVAGLDVAGPGEDETSLCIRRGGHILSLTNWANSDPRGEVAAALAPYKGQLETVNVDSAGIGYYMGKHLEDLRLPVAMVNVGETAGDREKYVNLKAELYWGLRMRLQEGDMSGLLDETAIAQLAGIRYEHNARGQVVIESKEAARKRGVKSPDRAEAIMLAFAARGMPNVRFI